MKSKLKTCCDSQPYLPTQHALAACCLPGRPCKDAIRDERRDGLKKSLLDDWEQRSGIFLNDQLKVLQGINTSVSACQLLGFCVCSGVGKVSRLFTQNLVSFIKPLFSLPRKPRKKNGEQVLPEPLPQETPEDKRRKVNRKLLEAGLIVAKISRHSQPKLNVKDFEALGEEWAALAANCLNDDPNELSNMPGSELWFYVGYANFQLWSLTLLHLTDAGVTEEGFQKLVVQRLNAKAPEILFAQIFGEAGFSQEWDVQFYTIHSEERRLQGEDTIPNWVVVKELQATCDDSLRFRFWKGTSVELQPSKARPAKKQPPKQRKPGAQQRHGPQPRRLKHPGIGKTVRKVFKNSKSKGSATSHAASVPQSERESVEQEFLPDQASEADSEEFEDDLFQRHLEEFGDNLSDFEEPGSDLEDQFVDFVESLGVGLQVSHPSSSSGSSGVLPNQFVAEVGGPEDSVAVAEAPVTREPVANVPQEASGGVVGAADEPQQPQQPPQPVREAEPAVAGVPIPVAAAPKARVVGARRPPAGADPSVEVPHHGELRYNPLSKRIIAVCRNPLHGDCRRSRTTMPAARDSARFLGQGRPVGILVHFLMHSDDFEDGEKHRAMLKEIIPLEDRKSARAAFEALDESDVILSEEREKRSNEADEPDQIF